MGGSGASVAGLAEFVGDAELFAELGGAEVFAEVGEALLEGVEGVGDGVGVGEGDVAPHGVGAGAESSGFAEGSASDGGDLATGFGVASEGVFEEGGEGGGEHLGEVGDPGADLVVAGGVKIEGAGSEASDEGAPFGFKGVEGRGVGVSSVGLAGGCRGEEPGGVAEEGGFGEAGAAGFLAGHGVSGEKSSAAGLVVEACGGLGDGELGAADVGEEGVGGSGGGEAFHPVEDGEDGAGEEDKVGRGLGWVGGGVGGEASGDGADVEGLGKGVGRGVPAGDVAGESGVAEGEADGGADEAGAEDEDALDHGCVGATDAIRVERNPLRLWQQVRCGFARVICSVC